MITFSKTHPKIELEDLARIENLYAISFPEDYRNHLLSYNGGIPSSGVFSFTENGEVTQSRIHFFYAINSDDYDDMIEAIDTFKKNEKRMPNNIFPIAEDPFGNVICISVDKKKDYNHIFFWNHEREVDYSVSNDNDYSNLYLIAKSFKEFINNLS